MVRAHLANLSMMISFHLQFLESAMPDLMRDAIPLKFAISEVARLKVYEMVWNYSKELMTWPALMITALVALKKDVFVRAGNTVIWPLIAGLVLFSISVAAGIMVMGTVSGGLVEDAASGAITSPRPQSQIFALIQFGTFGLGGIGIIGYAIYLATRHVRPLSTSATGAMDDH
jgi:hypothetical protein